MAIARGPAPMSSKKAGVCAPDPVGEENKKRLRHANPRRLLFTRCLVTLFRVPKMQKRGLRMIRRLLKKKVHGPRKLSRFKEFADCNGKVVVVIVCRVDPDRRSPHRR
jgi:hypothetical protein